MIWIITGFILIGAGAFNYLYHRKEHPRLSVVVGVFCAALGVWYISIGTSLLTAGG